MQATQKARGYGRPRTANQARLIEAIAHSIREHAKRGVKRIPEDYSPNPATVQAVRQALEV